MGLCENYTRDNDWTLQHDTSYFLVPTSCGFTIYEEASPILSVAALMTNYQP